MAASRPSLNSGLAAAISQPARIVGPPERLLTAKEVADWLGVSARWVLSHASGVNRPALPSVKLGKAVRFERSDIEEFIRDCARRYRTLRGDVHGIP